MKDIREALKPIGYTPHDNLIEYWFENENKCIQRLDSVKPSWGQKVSTQLRWKTQLGEELANQVKKYIESQQEIACKQTNSLLEQGKTSFVQAVIDFNLLNINIGKESKHINDWLYTISSNSGTYSGWTDLRGIDLHSISIHSAELKNASFAYSDFSNSKLNQITIHNCHFQECNFSKAFIAIVSESQKVSFHNSDFQGAKLNAISLGDNSIGTRPKIREISYFNLVATAIAGKKSTFCSGHTDFSSVTLSAGSNGEEQKHLSYISWYQDTILKYTNETDCISKFKNIILAITTKNWCSLRSVLLTCTITIMFFATIYYYLLGDSSFNKPFPSFMSAIYYSVVTFSTLGYGDITPNTDNSFTLIIVILEVLIGYALLGVLLFVLSNRVNERKP
jgi:uncharacterized protein YjbI with pentapeptide repeats